MFFKLAKIKRTFLPALFFLGLEKSLEKVQKMTNVMAKRKLESAISCANGFRYVQFFVVVANKLPEVVCCLFLALWLHFFVVPVFN